MARVNYQYEKRQRDLAKKKKKEEKLLKKKSKVPGSGPETYIPDEALSSDEGDDTTEEDSESED